MNTNTNIMNTNTDINTMNTLTNAADPAACWVGFIGGNVRLDRLTTPSALANVARGGKLEVTTTLGRAFPAIPGWKVTETFTRPRWREARAIYRPESWTPPTGEFVAKITWRLGDTKYVSSKKPVLQPSRFLERHMECDDTPYQRLEIITGHRPETLTCHEQVYIHRGEGIYTP